MALMPCCQGCLPFSVDLPALKAFPAVLMLGGYELGDVNMGGFVPFGFGQNGELPLWVCLYLYGTDGADMGRTIVGLY